MPYIVSFRTSGFISPACAICQRPLKHILHMIIQISDGYILAHFKRSSESIYLLFFQEYPALSLLLPILLYMPVIFFLMYLLSHSISKKICQSLILLCEVHFALLYILHLNLIAKVLDQRGSFAGEILKQLGEAITIEAPLFQVPRHCTFP